MLVVFFAFVIKGKKHQHKKSIPDPKSEDNTRRYL